MVWDRFCATHQMKLDTKALWHVAFTVGLVLGVGPAVLAIDEKRHTTTCRSVYT